MSVINWSYWLHLSARCRLARTAHSPLPFSPAVYWSSAQCISVVQLCDVRPRLQPRQRPKPEAPAGRPAAPRSAWGGLVRMSASGR